MTVVTSDNERQDARRDDVAEKLVGAVLASLELRPPAADSGTSHGPVRDPRNWR
ncbi:MAG TPA: hypothetical protein VFP66_13540 [Candidatus Limnocylindrales bacterium]|nr:hypothetical protein [Candidatus Limnocylindrales bacterium]